MSWSAIANIVRSRFKTQIADVESLVTQYDNQSLDNPDNEIWCRLTIKSGETTQESIGSPSSNRDRTSGVMIAQLFAPIGKGDGELKELADVIRAAFKRVTQDGVTFKTPSIYEQGIREGMWQINVVCPFYADDIG
jgi:hypothetical protein